MTKDESPGGNPGTPTTSQRKSNASNVPRRPYATGWLHGFKAGAVDALRSTARRLPPEMATTLDELSEKYKAAHHDE